MREKRFGMKTASAVIVALLFSSMFFVSPINQVEANPIPSIPNPNMLVYYTIGDIGTHEPAWSYYSLVLSSCYDTLVSYDRGMVDSFRPLLVTEVPSLENGRISPDGLTYRFTIRYNSPLTPEDVEYSFERVMVYDQENGPARMLLEPLLGVYSTRESPYDDDIVVNFEDIDNAVEVEGNDVVFHLARIYPPLMHILASSLCSIVSKAWCVEHGDWPGTETTWESYNNLDDSPLELETQGYGPFMLESDNWLYSMYYPYLTREIVLVRNEDYWRGPARLERVEFVFNDNWESRKQLFLHDDSPNADICWVPSENYSELEGVEGIRVYTGLPTLDYLAMNFNFAIAENSPYIGSGELDGNGIPPDFFSDINIRKAFAYSIDYDTIINETYTGEALHPASLVIEGLPFHNPDQEPYTYNLDMARQHFQQAWGGEVWNKGFNLTLVYTDAGDAPMGGWREIHPLRRMIAETLKNSIEAINANFHVAVQQVIGSGWSSRTRELTAFCNNDYWLNSVPDPDNIIAPLMHSTGYIADFQGYNDSTVDSLIEAGMNTIDPAERQAIYYELQRIYHEDVPGIPLVQPLTHHYQRDWVWGWYHNPAAAGMDFYEMLKGTYQDATRNIVAHVEDLVDSGVLPADAGDSLAYKLGSVIYLMDMGDLLGASQLLNDFIEQVNALELPVGNGEELIALAQEIIEVLPKTPLSILMARALSISVLVLASGLFIAAIALLLDRERERREDMVIRVSIVYTFLSRLRESRWNIFTRKKEIEQGDDD